jgi:hypothetical protein
MLVASPAAQDQDPDLGRGHGVRGPQHGRAHTDNDSLAVQRLYRAHHRPPPQHHHGQLAHHGARPRQDRRIRLAQAPARQQEQLLLLHGQGRQSSSIVNEV